MKIRNAEDVRKWRLCVGCGACKPSCPEGNISLENVSDEGIRPRVSGQCRLCGECLVACSGLGYESPRRDKGRKGKGTEKGCGLFGDALEIWEGYAADERIREKGSSGGLVTALARESLASGRVGAVFHVQEDPESAFNNISSVSITESEVVRGCGSRYAPSSPCERLDEMARDPAKKLFIGKPCDIGALHLYFDALEIDMKNRPITLGIFCAGVPSSAGTRELLEENGTDPENVSKIRYRGNGWPGFFEAADGSGRILIQRDYDASWGFLQSFRPFRCYLCPDGTGECADVSLGDAWYKKKNGGKGLSLAVARTEKGLDLLKRCLDSGAIEAVRVSDEEVLQSQAALIGKRKSVFGRICTLRFLGIPAPKYKGFDLFRAWLRAGTLQQIKSVTGTARRAITRRYFLPSK